MHSGPESQKLLILDHVECSACGEVLKAALEACPICGGKSFDPTDAATTSPAQAGPEADDALYVAARWIRKVFVLILGCTVVAVGIIMIVTPGPAMVVIPAGLAILATEFVWARIALKRLKTEATHATRYTWRFLFGGKPKSKPPTPQ